MTSLTLKPTHTHDEQGDIASDPNRMNYEQDIIRLVGRVITVSLETMSVMKGLPLVETQ